MRTPIKARLWAIALTVCAEAWQVLPCGGTGHAAPHWGGGVLEPLSPPVTQGCPGRGERRSTALRPSLRPSLPRGPVPPATVPSPPTGSLPEPVRPAPCLLPPAACCPLPPPPSEQLWA